jgi:hypothetical protein
MLIAYYFMWHAGRPAPEQCEGSTWVTSQVRELSYIHSRDVTVFCKGPYEESSRYRDFMGWEMPWYSAQGSAGAPAAAGHALTSVPAAAVAAAEMAAAMCRPVALAEMHVPRTMESVVEAEPIVEPERPDDG